MTNLHQQRVAGAFILFQEAAIQQQFKREQKIKSSTV